MYHLDTCRPEFYYECDWNGARIIVIVQQTKNDSPGESESDEHSDSFATRRLSTLTSRWC